MSSPEGSTITFRRRAPADVRPRALAGFARKLEKTAAQGGAFDCLLTGDAELRKLNREWRGQDYATDVLSFPVRADSNRRDAENAEKTRRKAKRKPGDAEGAKVRWASHPGYLGDLAISLGRARAQAREFGHTTEEEVRILMLHGVLHLAGMDHETDGGRMARAERRWRRALGLPTGLIERVRP